MNCTLPVTGMDGSAVASAALALLLVGGLILGITRRSRGIGALAVIALAILGGGALSAAPAAQAATDTSCPTASTAPVASGTPPASTPVDTPAASATPSATPTPTSTPTPTPTPEPQLGSIAIQWWDGQFVWDTASAQLATTNGDGSTTVTEVPGGTADDLQAASCTTKTVHDGTFFAGLLDASGTVVAVQRVTSGAEITFDGLALASYTPFISETSVALGDNASAVTTSLIQGFTVQVDGCAGSFTRGSATGPTSQAWLNGGLTAGITLTEAEPHVLVTISGAR